LLPFPIQLTADRKVAAAATLAANWSNRLLAGLTSALEDTELEDLADVVAARAKLVTWHMWLLDTFVDGFPSETASAYTDGDHRALPGNPFVEGACTTLLRMIEDVAKTEALLKPLSEVGFAYTAYREASDPDTDCNFW